MNKPRIKVLALGGTIAMTRSDTGGVVPTLTGAALVAAVPGLDAVADIESHSFRQLPGAHLGYDDLHALAAEIAHHAQAGVDGLVITQGTDTIEETAFALDRLVTPGMPVVVTGAMRNPTVPGTDGPANLLAAVQVAASPQAHGLGCLVVLNDEIHASRYVRKVHTSSPSAFSSGQAGQLGWLAEGTVRIANRLEPMPGVALSEHPRQVRVALLTIALGDDGALIDAVAGGGFGGLVVEGTGGGHVPASVADALERAAQRIPVILASRTGAGEVLARTYGFTGGEIDLQRRGLIRAGWLDGVKAKVLLTLLLRHGAATRQDIDRAFQPWGGGADPA
ncbi:asparaginase [Bordetella sp. BOR01]|uniref:asparaginase n=1 Tax=Bordetella sp. BOR01 TaxID=2854779 RepID=UPI001C43BB46|nr:asparaginase [Bordetella sp. BOR01]MBV7483480.1 asparaginase [Bordetella sp. BOR01]